MVFRRIWLEITYGSRECAPVTLGIAPVAVGGDSSPLSQWPWRRRLQPVTGWKTAVLLFEDAATGAIAGMPSPATRAKSPAWRLCSGANARPPGGAQPLRTV